MDEVASQYFFLKMKYLGWPKLYVGVGLGAA